MDYPRRFQQPRKQRTEDGCKISLKKRKDGTVVKEIKGKCTKEQLEALSNNSYQDGGD